MLLSFADDCFSRANVQEGMGMILLLAKDHRSGMPGIH